MYLKSRVGMILLMSWMCRVKVKMKDDFKLPFTEMQKIEGGLSERTQQISNLDVKPDKMQKFMNETVIYQASL